MSTFVTPKFRNLNRSNFHQELKKRVNNYFIENKKVILLKIKKKPPATGVFILKPFYFGACT